MPCRSQPGPTSGRAAPLPPPRHSAGVAVAVALLAAACETKTGQTGVVLLIRSEAPVDCMRIVARPYLGEDVSLDKAVPEATGEAFRDFTLRALVYAGGPLGDTDVELQVTGHRGGCRGAIVSQGTGGFRFEQGAVGTTEVVLRPIGRDRDADGYADTDDCNPDDPRVHPRGANDLETGSECGDGVDNNCNDSLDEGCPCTGDRACFPARFADRAGVGTCRNGNQACVSGKFAICREPVLPATESCNGLDDDCDGTVDLPSCRCTDGEARRCYDAGPPNTAGVGVCTAGTSTCAGGTFGPCVGQRGPGRETCNNRDDDCDGTVDDADRADRPACSLTEGVCVGARAPCGRDSCGTAEYEPVALARGLKYVVEEGANDCDGADNDCDGRIDEGCPCAPGTVEKCHPLGPTAAATAGACTLGQRTCGTSATWGNCLGAISPTEETCNGTDDDCDGAVDDGVEGTGESCTTGLSGSCAPGERACLDGRMTCRALSPAVTESCNGADDDCDGTIDEGFDKANDPATCGAADGACVRCTAGSLCCGGTCADPRTDPFHCGTCDVACTAGDACCAGGCTSLADDRSNCGTCGTACAAAESCRAGTCVPTAETACDDGDDDFDGQADCADDDCVTGSTCAPGRTCRAGACLGATETACGNGLDDDGDSLVDCADRSDCPNATACGTRNGWALACRDGACVSTRERACGDGFDDDGDGLVDCADIADCAARTACDSTGGVCNSGRCAHETECGNGTDDDGDTLTDCRDADCPDGLVCNAATGATCAGDLCVVEGAALCGDGLDNDRDGRVDCADPGCPAGSACGGGATCCGAGGVLACVRETGDLCFDGLDNDCDGKADCEDSPDCACLGGGAIRCCGARCIQTGTDAANCGACGNSCDDQNPCTADSCTGACRHDARADRARPAGCDGAQYCCGGTCSRGFESGADCTNGRDDDCDGFADCRDPDCACALGTSCCGTSCQNTRSDAANCGGCGRACPAPADACSVAACVDGACAATAAPNRTACGTGGTCCGGSCRAATESPAECTNDLDDDCDGLVDCEDPDCGATTPGLAYCASEPASPSRCRNLRTDANHCGSCGNACPNGGPCVNGQCLRETTTGGAAACANGGDDDGDGLSDCADTDCADGVTCATDRSCCGGLCRQESCANKVDDDCDGLVDCDETSCNLQVCGTNQQCVGDRCTCTPASCPNGCCDGDRCVLYASQATGQCGTGGAACAACSGPTAYCSKSALACTGCLSNTECTTPTAPTCETATLSCSSRCTGAGAGSCGPGTTCCGGQCTPNVTNPLACGATCRNCSGFSCASGVCGCATSADCLTGEACVDEGANGKRCRACTGSYSGQSCKGATGAVCCGTNCGAPANSCCNAGTFVNGTTTTTTCGTNLQACQACSSLQGCNNGSCTTCTGNAQCAGGRFCIDGTCCPTGQFKYTDGSGVVSCVAACPPDKPYLCGNICRSPSDATACGTACLACGAFSCIGGKCGCNADTDCRANEVCEDAGAGKVCRSCSDAGNGKTCNGGAGARCCGGTCGNTANTCCNGTSFVTGSTDPAACGTNQLACIACASTQICQAGACTTCSSDAQCGSGKQCADSICCPTGQFKNGSSCVATCPGGTKVCGESCIASATSCTTSFACTADSGCGSGNCVGDGSNQHCCPVGWARCRDKGCVPNCEANCGQGGGPEPGYDRRCLLNDECVDSCCNSCGAICENEYCVNAAAEDSCVSACSGSSCPGKPNECAINTCCQ